MNFATSTLKFSLFILNILCCIFGVLALSASIFTLIHFDNDDSIQLPCILGIVLGSILILNTILGAFGVCRNSIRLTWIYSVFMLLLFGAHIAVLFLLRMDLNKLITERMTIAWNSEQNDSPAMADYETTYECCGKFGPSDYVDYGLPIPNSCYLDGNTSEIENLFAIGCIQKLTAIAENVETISNWALVGFEGVAAIIASMLAISFKNEERRRLYH